MSIKKEIEERVEYDLLLGEVTTNKLVKLYKKDPKYVKLFLKEIKTLNYGDEKRREEINEMLRKKASGKKYSIHILKPGEYTNKFERYKIRVTKY